MAPRKGNTISLYLQCINSVNQILLIRGKQISIALAIRSVDPRLRVWCAR